MLKKIARMMGYSVKNIRKSNEEDDILYLALKLARPTLALDCGANVGEFPKELRAAGFTGPVWCFEPNRECVEILNGIAAKDPLLRIFPFATASSEGELELNVSGKGGKMSSLLPQTSLMAQRFPRVNVRDRYVVPVTRLDTVLAKAGIDKTERLFLKTDTQGFDYETFKGLGEWANQVMAVKVELSVLPMYAGAPTHWEMLDLLRLHNFEPIFFSTVSRNFDGRIIEYDAMFVKTDGASSSL